jgi:hypothetical protein
LASFSLADGQLSLNHPKTLIVDANGDLFGTTDPSSQNSGGVVYEIVRTANGTRARRLLSTISAEAQTASG